MSEQIEPHIIKRYQIIKKVGSGAYGHVWKVIDKKEKQICALKKIFDAFQHSTDAKRTFRQITILYEIKDQNIIQLKNVARAQNDQDIYLVFEYMQSDLHNVITERILQDIHNRYIIYQIAKALKYLHHSQLIHRDLKPSNVLLNSDCQLKVCDFGLVRSLTEKQTGISSIMTQQVATRWYRAPQILLGSHSYGKPADIWSLGCIFAQMLIFKPLFPGNSTLNQLQRIVSFTGRPSKQDIYSLESETAKTMIQSASFQKGQSLKDYAKQTIPAEAFQLLQGMLKFNPYQRLTAIQILKHPYLSKFYTKQDGQLGPKKIISPIIDDNKKLRMKEYRSLIYEEIRRMFRSEDCQPIKGYNRKKQRSLQKSFEKKSNKSSIPQRSSSKKKQQQIKSCKKIGNYANRSLVTNNLTTPANRKRLI